MPRFEQILLRLIAVATLAPAIAACSSENHLNLLPSFEDTLSLKGGAQTNLTRPITPADLVSPDGACASVGPEGAVVASAAPNSGDQPPVNDTSQLLPGGIGLQMSECDVVRRAGNPDRIENGANERGERAVVLTYIHGPRPGIYRFSGGRLYSIEASPAPPPPPPKQKKPAKKPAQHA